MTDIAEAQRQIDTRALEIAKTALTLIEQHQRECNLERGHLNTTLGELKSSVSTIFGMLWTTAGISILTLITGLAVLIFFMITGHHP